MNFIFKLPSGELLESKVGPEQRVKEIGKTNDDAASCTDH